MMNPTIPVSAALAACLLMTTPLLAQAPAGPPNQARPLSSEELAKLPQTPGATGDQLRHYHFAEGQTESPYRIYVPKNYDGKTKMPLIVALHGAGGNENYFFKANYQMPDLMEKYGFIFVEPLGYHSFGGYGAGALSKPTVPLDPGVAPNPVAARRPQWTAQETQHVNDLSEKDVMNVLAIVEKEYAVDPSRVYLMGHSMGGMGTWYLGQKYAGKWAALGVMSGGFGYVDYPLERLKGIPIIVTAGGKDTAMHGPQAQAEFARFKAAGLDVAYIEIPDGTHMSNIPASFPQVIAFLASHRRSAK
jgi:predicted peptidase